MFFSDVRSDISVATDLMATCFDMYACSLTGLAPEVIRFQGGGDFDVVSSEYLLRPETVESLFILYRITHDPMYRYWGNRIFNALVQHCREDSGYSGILDVQSNHSTKDNRMQA